MWHIWKTDRPNKKSPPLYIDECFSKEAEEALKHGVTYTKVDGSNGYKLGRLLYRRYDDRKGKLDKENLPEGIIRLPTNGTDGDNIGGSNPDAYEGHNYFYKLLDLEDESIGKKERKQLAQLYAHLNEVSGGEPETLEDGSIELVGPAFNKTPGFERNQFVFHRNLEMKLPCERTFAAIKEWLPKQPIEGIIFEYRGVYWKVRADVFDRQCAFATMRKSK